MFFFILTTTFAIRKQKGYVPLVRLDVFVTFPVKLEDPEYKCYCFKCRLARMLLELLFSRGHLRLMSIVTMGNYLVSDTNF